MKNKFEIMDDERNLLCDELYSQLEAKAQAYFEDCNAPFNDEMMKQRANEEFIMIRKTVASLADWMTHSTPIEASIMALLKRRIEYNHALALEMAEWLKSDELAAFVKTLNKNAKKFAETGVSTPPPEAFEDWQKKHRAAELQPVS